MRLESTEDSASYWKGAVLSSSNGVSCAFVDFALSITAVEPLFCLEYPSRVQARTWFNIRLRLLEEEYSLYFVLAVVGAWNERSLQCLLLFHLYALVLYKMDNTF